MPIGARTFNKATSDAGVLLSPPDATMTALGALTYANGGRLYSEVIFFQNLGDEPIEIRTKEDYAPANAGEATVVVLSLAAGQRDHLPFIDPGNAQLDLGYGTHMFYAFCLTTGGTPVVKVDPV
jgi:hypothetical protein